MASEGLRGELNGVEYPSKHTGANKGFICREECSLPLLGPLSRRAWGRGLLDQHQGGRVLRTSPVRTSVKIIRNIQEVATWQIRSILAHVTLHFIKGRVAWGRKGSKD